MRSFITLLIFLQFICLYARAQHGDYSLGARHTGLGGASLTLSDAFSGFNNIGALAGAENTAICFTSAIPYNLPGLLKTGVAFNVPLLDGEAVINVFRFGNRNLNEHQVGIGYSNRMRFVSLGLKINYLQYKIKDRRSVKIFSFEFGGIVHIHTRLTLGAYLYYPFTGHPDLGQPRVAQALLKVGLSYRPSERIMMNAEYLWMAIDKNDLVFGIEYLIQNKVALRTGFSSYTLQPTMGIGFRGNLFSADYAIEIHPILGISQELSVMVNTRKQ